MVSQRDIFALAKLAEECGELASVASRCLVHGIDEKDANTQRVNRDCLMSEIADVLAVMALVTAQFNLDSSEIAEHSEQKKTFLCSVAARWP